jgi:hypothetical protein
MHFLLSFLSQGYNEFNFKVFDKTCVMKSETNYYAFHQRFIHSIIV